jgi:hypothetical protein
MSRIDSAGRIAEIIRRQVDALRDPAPRAAGRGAGQDLRPAARETVGLNAVITRRVQAIDPDDPDRRRKAFRVFLESVLLAELGEALINDAGFYQLVDQVQTRMQADAELARAMDEAADLLLARPR